MRGSVDLAAICLPFSGFLWCFWWAQRVQRSVVWVRCSGELPSERLQEGGQKTSLQCGSPAAGLPHGTFGSLRTLTFRRTLCAQGCVSLACSLALRLLMSFVWLTAEAYSDSGPKNKCQALTILRLLDPPRPEDPPAPSKTAKQWAALSVIQLTHPLAGARVA